MAYTGQTIENPVSGERITFLQTAHDTGGEKLEIELELSPDGHVPGAHVHPEQEERFHVLEGSMKFRMGCAGSSPAPATPLSCRPVAFTGSPTAATASPAPASRSSPPWTWKTC